MLMPISNCLSSAKAALMAPVTKQPCLWLVHNSLLLGYQEEQNASSSANYDVELLHSAEAHAELLKSSE